MLMMIEETIMTYRHPLTSRTLIENFEDDNVIFVRIPTNSKVVPIEKRRQSSKNKDMTKTIEGLCP